jgi:hypothetical protein
MLIVLSVIGVAFAAFCVWLTVRIVNRRERWAKWTAGGLAVCLPVLYVLGIGPAIWLYQRKLMPDSVATEIEQFYLPLAWLRAIGPEPISDAFDWYTELWRKPDNVYDSTPVSPSPDIQSD